MSNKENEEWEVKPIKIKVVDKDKKIFVVIMKSSDWWDDFPLKPKLFINCPVPCKYVVGQYSTYNNGEKNITEGRIARALFDGFDDAMILFDNITKPF